MGGPTSIPSRNIDNDYDLRDKKNLLHSISGVGKRVSAQRTALPAGRSFACAEQTAAYLGLLPVEWESGTSIHARPCTSKVGPAYLRRLLYFPAVVACQHNPHLGALY
jgi:transposase